jgi:transposase-like protein
MHHTPRLIRPHCDVSFRADTQPSEPPIAVSLREACITTIRRLVREGTLEAPALEATMSKKRRQFTAESKARMLVVMATPGVNVAELARAEGLQPASLYEMRRRAKLKGKLPAPELPQASPFTPPFALPAPDKPEPRRYSFGMVESPVHVQSRMTQMGRLNRPQHAMLPEETGGALAGSTANFVSRDALPAAGCKGASLVRFGDGQASQAAPSGTTNPGTRP